MCSPRNSSPGRRVTSSARRRSCSCRRACPAGRAALRPAADRADRTGCRGCGCIDAVDIDADRGIEGLQRVGLADAADEDVGRVGRAAALDDVEVRHRARRARSVLRRMRSSPRSLNAETAAGTCCRFSSVRRAVTMTTLIPSVTVETGDRRAVILREGGIGEGGQRGERAAELQAGRVETRWGHGGSPGSCRWLGKVGARQAADELERGAPVQIVPAPRDGGR